MNINNDYLQLYAYQQFLANQKPDAKRQSEQFRYDSPPKNTEPPQIPNAPYFNRYK